MILEMNENDLEFLVQNLDLFDEFWNEKILRDEFENENSKYFVMKDEKEILGFCGLWFNIDEVHIMNIAVSKEFRKNGFGTEMLRYLIEVAKSEKKKCLTLEVREDNIPAISLYKKLDFIEVGKRKKYYDGKFDAIIMTKFFVH